MAVNEEVPKKDFATESNDDYEELEKILSVVVKRRKTFPAKCMELNKRKAHFELLRLENASVITEESNQEQLKQIIEEFRKQNYLDFTLDDLIEVKHKLEKYQRRNEEVHNYLAKRDMIKLNF